MCVTCFRKLNEIAGWGNLSAQAQWAVVDQLPARRAAFAKALED